MSEKKIEKKCKGRASTGGWYVRKFGSPAHRGVPDDIFLKDRRWVTIEFKNPGNEPTDLQWLEMLDIQEHGGEAYWCDNYEDFCAILALGRSRCAETCTRLSKIPERLRA